MAKGVYAALSGAIAAQTSLDVTAQNLANAATTGFKRVRPVFRETLASAQAGNAGPRDNRFASVSKTVIDLTAGAIRSTGRQLDISPKEGVFVAVRTDAGERYVRGGHIEVADGGELTLNGHTLVGTTGEPISVQSNNVRVTEDGQILADDETVAALKLVSFGDASQLGLEGATTFVPTRGSGAATSSSAGLVVGAVEESNVAPVSAMTELITTTRVFEAFQRTIDAFRDADRRIVTTLGQ